MPNVSYSPTNLYTGKVASALMLEATAGFTSLRAGAFAIDSDVNGSIVYGIGKNGIKINKSTAARNDNSTSNINNRQVTPKRLSATLLMDKNETTASYVADQLPPGIGVHAQIRQSPWVGALIQNTADIMSALTEQLTWNGRTLDFDNLAISGADLPKGFIPEALEVVPAGRRASAGATVVATAIGATGILTVPSNTFFKDGDTITFIQNAGSAVTVNSENIVGQSFNVRVLSATSLQLYGYDGVEIDVTGAGTKNLTINCINASNVVEALYAVNNYLPANVRYAVTPTQKMVFVCSPNVFEAYRQSQSQAGFNGSIALPPQTPLMAELYGKTLLNFNGIELMVVPGMQANSIMLYNSANLKYVSAGQFFDKINAIDLSQTTNEAYYSIRYDFSLDTAILLPNELAIAVPKLVV